MTPHPDEGMLHAFIDGELSAGDATALETHVADCAQCGVALAEARGLVAGASRAISALDAAPLSAANPLPSRPAANPSPRPTSKPFVFRAPFARAAALLLLAGGSAVVINRSVSNNGATESSASLSESVTLTEGRASDAQHVEAAPSAAANAAPAPVAPMAERDFSGRGVSAGVGAASQKQLATPAAPAAPIAAAAVTNDANAVTNQASRERAAAAPPAMGALSGRVGASGTAATAPTATASGSVPRPPARMAASEAISMTSVATAARVTRYRTREGVTLTLTEEPLQTAFAEESTVARRGVARPLAQASAPVVNTYRWSSAEQGKSFTLTGALSITDLEAASKRLGGLERVP